MDQFLTVRQCVRATGIPERWIRQRVRAGELTIYGAENSWPRIRVGELVQLYERTAR